MGITLLNVSLASLFLNALSDKTTGWGQDTNILVILVNIVAQQTIIFQDGVRIKLLLKVFTTYFVLSTQPCKTF
jgi:hypothetical protein